MPPIDEFDTTQDLDQNPVPVAGDGEVSTDWGQMADDDLRSQFEEPPAPAAPAAPVSEPAPGTPVAAAPTPTPEPAAPVSAPVPPVEASAAPPVATPTPAVPLPETPPAPTPQPVLTSPDLTQVRQKWEQELQGQYKMSDEDALKMITHTNEVLPALAARLHVNIMEQAIGTVTALLQQQLPTYLEQWKSSTAVAETAEQKFFSEWGELAPHKEQVVKIARMYRDLNPTASAEEFNRAVGVQAWMALKLSPADLVAKMSGGQPSAAAPASQPSRPFSPAPASTLPPPSVPVTNPYQQMADSWTEDF